MSDAAPKEAKAAESLEMSPEQLEQVLIPKYTNAVALGVDLLNRLTKTQTEEEEEEEVERPKKKARRETNYSRYPLPYIIGTKEFDEDEFCGIHIGMQRDRKQILSFFFLILY